VVVKWKKQLPDSSSEMFASGKGLAPDRESEIKALQSKIGEIMCSLRGCGAMGSRKKCISTRMSRCMTLNNGYASCFLECLRIYFPLVFLKLILLLPKNCKQIHS
ncbi:uncharacterized protein METZ01_LOCUS510851, partial [marine metagenome]